jgi:tetratricopeptide (TPR) repeat protein
MAKKKAPRSSNTQGFGKKRLLPELQKAEALIARQQWAEAKQTLETLAQSYPDNPDVFVCLVNFYLDMQDIKGYARTCERLVKIDPKNADAAYGLAGGYLSCFHPLLAQQAFHHALEQFPNHEKAAEAQKFVADLDGKIAEMLENMGLTGENSHAIALLHEKGQLYLERGDYAEARQAEEEVLRLKPDFWSAYNNLSLISYSEGDVEGAIATAKHVLDQQPDNIHACANLIRFYCVTGQPEKTQPLTQQLKASDASGWEPWTKKAEALSYLGDDAGVLEVFEQAKKSKDLGITNALFHHLVAVAMARLEQVKQARQQWQTALNKSPNFALAQANLDNLKHPISQQHGAWAFDLQYWLNQSDIDDLTAILKPSTKSKDDAAIANAIERYLHSHPHILRLIPILLERGDPIGREFAFRCASVADTPEMLEILRNFALSQSGPDQMRHQAAIKVSEAGLFPSETVRMWLKGKWHDVMMIAYEFHEIPPYNHSHKVENWLREAIALLRQGDRTAAKQAEDLMKKAIEVEPDTPDLLNNLAAAYLAQERAEEGHALIRQITEQFPDYVYAKAALARLHIRQGELDAAEALLKPMLSRKRFHIDDFGVFSSIYIELLLARDQPEAAQAWLNMWEGVDPEHPELQSWKIRLSSPKVLQNLAKLFSQ